jgi:uncharacterized repeat protein (TIGR03847 family)
MTRIVHTFDNPQRFITGTVGVPGERTFFLQARTDQRIVSVSLEKQQVALLADRLTELLDQVARAEGIDIAYFGPADLEPLDNPIQEEFRVGTLALGWNTGSQQVVIEAHATSENFEDVPDLEEDADYGPDVLRVRLSAAIATAFCSRAQAVVSAGRPPCPLCTEPLDQQGHICPRANGYLRRG